MASTRWVAPILLASAWLATPVQACKYTVRDVAFVDLASEPYRLCVFVRSDTSPAVVDTVRKALAASLLDTNVAGEVIDLDADPASEKTRLLDGVKIEGYPTAVLLAPDGRSLPLDFPRGKEGLERDSIWPALESVASSTARREALEHLFDAHSVILIAEGRDPTANRAAREMAAAARDAIAEDLDRLPKPIARPPVEVVVPADRAAAERVVLWSLGMPIEPGPDAHVAVLFGRMRRIGPVLSVPGVTRAELTSALAIVGQDCECDLDRSWMEGPAAPHRWGDADAARAVKTLGFDPSNPLVKAEVGAILARGSSSGRRNRGSRSPSFDPLLDYQEIVLEPVADSSLRSPTVPEPDLAVSDEVPARDDDDDLGTPPAPFAAALLTAGAIAAVSLVIGFAIGLARRLRKAG